MKKTKVLILTIAVILSSCNTPSALYYQLYNTESCNANIEENGLTYENENIKVVYNFWNKNGNSSFQILNKTDSNIFIDLKKSHLIINGIAKTYFQNRTFSSSTQSSLNMRTFIDKNISSLGNSYLIEGYGSDYTKGFSITYFEKDIICIPANSAKVFNGFSLNSNLYRDCDLLLYPSHKAIKTKKFVKETSPLIFTNIISYGFNEKKLNKIENDFWVSEITNYSTKDFFERKHPEFCGEQSYYLDKYYIYQKANRFYIKYEKSEKIEFKH